jgi:gluconate 2-dehydrogenase gamma chain
MLHELAPARRDAVLTAVESGKMANGPAFFNRLRRLAMEGMFSDPRWGGNANFAGWDLIRYPGPRLVVAAEDQKLEAAPKPTRKSAWGMDHDGH